MAKSYAQIQEKQCFDDLRDFLDGEFQQLPVYRSGNATRYEMGCWPLLDYLGYLSPPPTGRLDDAQRQSSYGTGLIESASGSVPKCPALKPNHV
jgi:hypothetical protein